MLKKIIVTLILSLPLSVWAQPTSNISTQQDLINDLNAFANASCLAQQKDLTCRRLDMRGQMLLFKKILNLVLKK